MTRYQGKPFSLLWVDGGDEPDRLRALATSGQITWPVFCDRDNAIHNQWDVHQWPTTFTIDAEGIIRHRDVLGAELDRAIETLIEKIDRSK